MLEWGRERRLDFQELITAATFPSWPHPLAPRLQLLHRQDLISFENFMNE